MIQVLLLFKKCTDVNLGFAASNKSVDTCSEILALINSLLDHKNPQHIETFRLPVNSLAMIMFTSPRRGGENRKETKSFMPKKRKIMYYLIGLAVLINANNEKHD